MSAPARKPQGTEALAPSSIASRALFPGRTVLYPSEVAKTLGMVEQQVIDLIEEGKLGAINIGSGLTPRKHWRIPVSAYDQFLARRKNA